MATSGTLVQVGDRRLRLSNLDKVLFPEAGFTKGAMIEYYLRVAAVMLPHLAGRPVTLKRFPDGTGASGFFNKNAPSHTPDWIRTVTLASPHSGKDRGEVRYLLLDEPAALVWTANLAGVELHVPPWRVGPGGAMHGSDRLVFDLDPGAPAGRSDCARVALLLRDLLAEDGLTAYPGVSGGKGMHLYTPIAETPPPLAATYARRVAAKLEEQHPELVLIQMTKAQRGGRVFIDWSQNSGPKTTVAPYSLRAKESPTVALPLSWDEIDPDDADSLVFAPDDALDLLDERGDTAAPILREGPPLPVADEGA
ncbi:MAG: non-homologous end-joining DNA ligase [Actinocrinis sp.]